MELNEEELQASIEAAGTRYKWLRTQLAAGSMPSTEKEKKEANLSVLNSVIKKLLEYQKEHFPQAQGSDLENNDEAEEELSMAVAQDFSSTKVLIVDDDASERSQIKSFLLAQGFAHIDESNDGHNAVAAIKANSMPYDLVICDYKMPTIGGLDVLKIIRQEEKYLNMPFLMISNQGSKQIIEDSMAAGVNAYIVKPISAENLIPKVLRILSSEQLTPDTDAEVEPGGESKTEKDTDTDKDNAD